MSTWQPIDTAPKDGTRVLLWIPGLRECRQLGCFDVYETFRNGVSTYRSEKWEWGAMILSDERRPEPSHWQELPGAPPIPIQPQSCQAQSEWMKSQKPLQPNNI